MTITFYYMLDYPLEKAAELATYLYDKAKQSLIIVETDERSYLGEHAVANTLALLSSFSHSGRRSIVCFPFDENLLMVATLFTDYVYLHNDDGFSQESSVGCLCFIISEISYSIQAYMVTDDDDCARLIIRRGFGLPDRRSGISSARLGGLYFIVDILLEKIQWRRTQKESWSR
ncbi:unnamed protein product [Strongylus vulgaris]|uniref:Uncharacterized protein n=1 Tax=Strongylus vulgaris TaxID=40348 RepID=A0A3P7ICZ7_STRVU|nr:unnamed protein product [Strongylus vulgaris]